MNQPYVKECIDLNLEEHPKHEEIMTMQGIEQLVELVDGHPLAAKMVASYLKVKSPGQLLNPDQKHKLQLQLAEFILHSASRTILTEAHQLFLEILAAVGEPVALEDILSIKALKNYSLDDVHQVRLELTDLFLIEQDGERMSLHNFLRAYFQDKIEEERWSKIAEDYGHYAYNKTTKLNKQLLLMLEDSATPHSDIMTLTNDILRYCLPAGRFLRYIGEVEMAEELPIQITGTIREMVFYFYQTKRDYRTAADYAEKWLKIVPKDTEILLYYARCFRNFRDTESLVKAEKIINRLERIDSGPRILARIHRERALIAQSRGEFDEAKEKFQEGIDAYTPYPYPENHVGLAQLLLIELDRESLIFS